MIWSEPSRRLLSEYSPFIVSGCLITRCISGNCRMSWLSSRGCRPVGLRPDICSNLLIRKLLQIAIAELTLLMNSSRYVLLTLGSIVPLTAARWSQLSSIIGPSNNCCRLCPSLAGEILQFIHGLRLISLSSGNRNEGQPETTGNTDLQRHHTYPGSL